MTYYLQILDPGVDSTQHLLLFLIRRRTRVKRGLESVTHLLHAKLDLLAVEEHYKHCLLKLMSLKNGKIRVTLLIYGVFT